MVISLQHTKCLHLRDILVFCLLQDHTMPATFCQSTLSVISTTHIQFLIKILRFVILMNFQSSDFKIHYWPRPKVFILQFLTLRMEKFPLAPEQFLEFNTCGWFGPAFKRWKFRQASISWSGCDSDHCNCQASTLVWQMFLKQNPNFSLPTRLKSDRCLSLWM